jgi:hypothetical protein
VCMRKSGLEISPLSSFIVYFGIKVMKDVDVYCVRIYKLYIFAVLSP